MQIDYLGHSCFKIKGNQVSLITDPYEDYVGFRMPKVAADIITISHDHQDHNNIENVDRKEIKYIVSGPGEYEIRGVSIIGIRAFHDNKEGALRGENTIYHIELDDLSLCHLGDLGHVLTSEQVEELNGVDVLFVPIGGIYTIDPKKAIEVINQIEPLIVIPMHYRTDQHSEAFREVLTVDWFLEELGTENVKREKNLILKKSTLPEEMEVVVISKVSK